MLGPYRRYPVWSSRCRRSEGCTGWPVPLGRGRCESIPTQACSVWKEAGKRERMQSVLRKDQEDLVEGPLGIVSQHQSCGPLHQPQTHTFSLRTVCWPLSALQHPAHWHPLPPIFGVLPFSPAGFSLQPQCPGSLGPLPSFSELWRPAWAYLVA